MRHKQRLPRILPPQHVSLGQVGKKGTAGWCRKGNVGGNTRGLVCMGWCPQKFLSILKVQMKWACPHHTAGTARGDVFCKAGTPWRVIRALSLPVWVSSPPLTMLASSSFFAIVFSVFLRFSLSYPLLNLFSQFLLLLSACACVFSASNFCHISCLNFSSSISFPMLILSVYFILCKHFSFHFQGLFPFDLCLFVCIYTHTDTYTYIYINLEALAFCVSKLVCPWSQFVIPVSFTLLSYFLCCYPSLNTIQ